MVVAPGSPLLPPPGTGRRMRPVLCPILLGHVGTKALAGVPDPWTAGRMRPRVAVNAAQHKTANLLKAFFFCSSVFVSVCVFYMWSKTTLLPVWPSDTSGLDTPARDGGSELLTSVLGNWMTGVAGSSYQI